MVPAAVLQQQTRGAAAAFGTHGLYNSSHHLHVQAHASAAPLSLARPPAAWPLLQQQQQQHPQQCGGSRRVGVAARSRRSRQSPPDDSESSVDEPVIDVARKVEAICSQLPVHPSHVRSLVQRHNGLALLPLDKLVQGLPPLAHALGVPLRQALHMAARQPAVLDRDPQQLADACGRLAAAVDLPAEQAMFMAARQPLLLECQPDRLAAEAAKLAAVLGCSPKGALLLLSRLSGPELRQVLSMSASSVLQRLPEVVEALGLPSDSTRALDAMAWVVRNPSLLAASPDAIGRSTDALLVAFQGSAPGTFAAVLARCPGLLTHPAEQLLASYQGLLLQLQVSRQVAARMLAKHPQLLRASPDNIGRKLRAMAFSMYLPQAQVVSMCVRQPALLSSDSTQLQQRLEHLQHMLGGTYQAAVLAVARAPNLLLLTPALLDAKRQLLQRHTGLPEARLGTLLLQHPGLLTRGSSQLAAGVEALLALLQVAPGDPALGQVLLEVPGLLLRREGWLQEQAALLQEFLVLPPDRLAPLLRRCPRVLTAGPTTWLSNLSSLLDVLQASPLQVQEAVVAEPRLLRLAPDPFRQQVAQTVQLLAQHPPWQVQLRSLTYEELLALLRVRGTGHLRLLYLLQSGQAGDLGQAAEDAVDSRVFGRKYPGFQRWSRRVPQAAAASLAAAAAAAAAARGGMQQAVAAPVNGAGAAAGELQQVPPPPLPPLAQPEQQLSPQQQQQQPQLQQLPRAGPPSAAARSMEQQLQQSQQQQRRQQPQQLMPPPVYRPVQQADAGTAQPSADAGSQQQQQLAGSAGSEGSRAGTLQAVPAR